MQFLRLLDLSFRVRSQLVVNFVRQLQVMSVANSNLRRQLQQWRKYNSKLCHSLISYPAGDEFQSTRQLFRVYVQLHNVMASYLVCSLAGVLSLVNTSVVFCHNVLALARNATAAKITLLFCMQKRKHTGRFRMRYKTWFKLNTKAANMYEVIYRA